MQAHYTVQSGDFSPTYSSLELAIQNAKRIGLARCEEARVISPSGKIVHTY